MGKAADNERIKIVATACNNTAVGLALGACLLPLIALYPHIETIKISDILSVRALSLALGFIVALFAAIFFHRAALSEIAKIQD